MEELTNRDFANTNTAFKNACKKACIKNDTRQASKYRNKRGIAYKFSKHPETKYLQRQVQVNAESFIQDS